MTTSKYSSTMRLCSFFSKYPVILTILLLPLSSLKYDASFLTWATKYSTLSKTLQFKDLLKKWGGLCGYFCGKQPSHLSAICHFILSQSWVFQKTIVLKIIRDSFLSMVVQLQVIILLQQLDTYQLFQLPTWEFLIFCCMFFVGHLVSNEVNFSESAGSNSPGIHKFFLFINFLS